MKKMKKMIKKKKNNINDYSNINIIDDNNNCKIKGIKIRYLNFI